MSPGISNPDSPRPAARSSPTPPPFAWSPDVPLVIPEVNFEHLELARRTRDTQDLRRLHRHQPQLLGHRAGSCAQAPAAALRHREPLRLHHAGRLRCGLPRRSRRSTSSATSSRYIRNEEEKLQEECNKLLGTLEGNTVQPLPARLSAHCNRVAVEDGHTECVSVKLKTPATYEQIAAAWAEFQPFRPTGAHFGVHLPTAPLHPVEYDATPDRPQPRLDRNRGNGMTVTVGRLRPCPLLDWKFVVLSHNTVRGAAGAAVLNAEVLAVLGKLNFKRFPPMSVSPVSSHDPQTLSAETVMVDA